MKIEELGNLDGTRRQEHQVFPYYVKGRKNINKIWDLPRSNGSKATTFQEVLVDGVSYFKKLYKDPKKVKIIEIL
jgi:hypothetical protein